MSEAVDHQHHTPLKLPCCQDRLTELQTNKRKLEERLALSVGSVRKLTTLALRDISNDDHVKPKALDLELTEDQAGTTNSATDKSHQGDASRHADNENARIPHSNSSRSKMQMTSQTWAR